MGTGGSGEEEMPPHVAIRKVGMIIILHSSLVTFDTSNAGIDYRPYRFIMFRLQLG